MQTIVEGLRLPTDMSLNSSVFLNVAAALFVHSVYKRFEFMPSQHLPTLVLLVLLPSLPAIYMMPFFAYPLISVFVSFLLFYSTLLTSIVLYRISPFHPLAKYPGPVWAKVTKLWGMYSMSTGKYYETLRRLHEQYGVNVRIGPNEISTIDISIMSSVLGAEGMPRGPMWDARVNPNIKVRPLIATRSLHEHASRRKRWNRGFSTAAVKGYEPIITRRALQLVEELERRSNSLEGGNRRQSVDLAQWFSFFTFDFMGDMVFGGGFELMRDGGDREGIWKLMEEALEISAVIQHVPWLAHILYQLPGVTNSVRRLRDFAMEKAKCRRENGAVMHDLFHHLIDEDHVEKVRPSEAEVLADGLLAIVAGSDTTSSVLSGVFFHLLSNPTCYKRLQEEVDSAFPLSKGNPFDSAKLANMIYLNAVINETLRIQPPNSTSIQRAPAIGSGGKWLGSDMWIPEGTAITVSPYVLFRSPAYFTPDPDVFWPERWLHASSAKRTPKQFSAATNANADVLASKVVPGADYAGNSSEAQSDEVLTNTNTNTNTAAFIPFSYGPANCAGRNLAVVEMRMVVALLMQRFDMRFADAYDPDSWAKAIKDWLVVKLGDLPVVLTPRV